MDMERLPEVLAAATDMSRDWWQQFLKGNGLSFFQQILVETEAGEQIDIDITLRTWDHEPIPEAVGLMVVMHAAIKALALSTLADAIEWQQV